MPRMYPATVRRQIAQRLRSGEAIAAIAVETGIAQATLFRWKRQALIDAGVIEGTPSVEADELAAAHKRIAQLEAELALTRDAPDRAQRACSKKRVSAGRVLAAVGSPSSSVWRGARRPRALSRRRLRAGLGPPVSSARGPIRSGRRQGPVLARPSVASPTRRAYRMRQARCARPRSPIAG